MKLNPVRFLLFTSVIVILSSCLNTTTDVTSLSTNPSFTSLTFKANSSIPNIQTAAFTLVLDPLVGDSVIENLDSLPYNTRIDSVYPTFTFKSSAKAYLIYTGTIDTVKITGTDTIDFSKPLKIRNYAIDAVHKRDYYIKVNVHKVEPELYVWKKLNDAIETDNATSQKTIWYNSQLYYYLNNGSNAFLYTSGNGVSWGSKTLSGFPNNTALGDMTLFNNKLFLSHAGSTIYSSSDGLIWSNKTVSDYAFKSLLFVFDSKIWAVIQSNSDSTLRFANSVDGDTWIVRGEIPVNFPVRDFASLSFTTRNGKPKVLLIGGYSNNDVELKSRWSSEDCVYWVDFSQENHSLDTLATGASVIAYDNKLLLYGGREENNKIVGDYYRQSIDEGLSWQKTDSAYNLVRIPIVSKITTNGIEKDTTTYINYEPRSYQSAIVDNSNRIYLVGGKTNSATLSDVWTGKLNRKSFIRQ